MSKLFKNLVKVTPLVLGASGSGLLEAQWLKLCPVHLNLKLIRLRNNNSDRIRQK